MALLTDAQGRTIGMLRTAGTITRIYTAQGKYLGVYYSGSNTTFDSTGRRVGTGNLLTNLLSIRA